MRELALHILDIAQNSLAAGAQHIEIEVDEDLQKDRLTITIRDDGKGMDPEAARRALDPFVTSRTTRKVGLGLPLFAAAAQRCDGNLAIDSTPGRGTTVTAWFRHGHIDRAPLGDIPGTVASLIALNPDREFSYRHRINGIEFSLQTEAVRERVGDVPLSHPEIYTFIRQYLHDGICSLQPAGS